MSVSFFVSTPNITHSINRLVLFLLSCYNNRVFKFNEEQKNRAMPVLYTTNIYI